MDVASTLRCIENMPYDISIMLKSKHGVGKSDLIRQFSLNYELILRDIRLSQCDVGDVKGYPNPDHEKKMMEFFKAYWWPRDPTSKGIILFDELNRAARDVQQSVFEVCLDRRLDGEALPNGWRVIACVNGDEIYQTTPMDFALEDRWFVIDFEPTKQDWINWASKHNIHTTIINFIDINEKLLDPPMVDMVPGTVYPSRRSWAKLSRTIEALDLFNQDRKFFTQVAAGWVGPIAGPAYVSWALNHSFISPKQVLGSFDTVANSLQDLCKDLSAISSLSNSVVREFKILLAPEKKSCNLNLKKFFKLVPDEVAADLFRQLNGDLDFRKYLSPDWQKDKSIVDRLNSFHI